MKTPSVSMKTLGIFIMKTLSILIMKTLGVFMVDISHFFPTCIAYLSNRHVKPNGMYFIMLHSSKIKIQHAN